MPDTLANALRARLRRSPSLRQHMRDLHEVSGMDCTLVDPDGTCLLALPRNCSMPLCRILRQAKQTERACIRCRQQLRTPGETSRPIASPAGGLREITHRISADQHPVGLLVLFGYRDPHSGLEEARTAWTRSARARGNISWPQWHAAWQQTPEITPERAAALQRWLALAAEHCLRHSRQEPAPPENSRAFPHRVHLAVKRIHERHAEPLRLRDIAKECGVSPEHLSRLFHQSTGLRFREYLAEVRIHHACTLLAETNHTIADIAEQVGYSTLSRFNSGFRTHTGITPSAYRKRAFPSRHSHP